MRNHEAPAAAAGALGASAPGPVAPRGSDHCQFSSLPPGCTSWWQLLACPDRRFWVSRRCWGSPVARGTPRLVGGSACSRDVCQASPQRPSAGCSTAAQLDAAAAAVARGAGVLGSATQQFAATGPARRWLSRTLRPHYRHRRPWWRISCATGGSPCKAGTHQRYVFEPATCCDARRR